MLISELPYFQLVSHMYIQTALLLWTVMKMSSRLTGVMCTELQAVY